MIASQAAPADGGLNLSTPASRVSSAERRWALGFAGVLMLVTLLPYVLGYALQGQDWRFTGFVFNIEDGHSYLAKMLSGASGAWLFRTPYTAEPQAGVVAYLPYLLLGKLTAPPGQHEQLVALYHLFRLAAGALAVLATYDFLSVFLSDVRLRRLGTALAAAGGGLGWALVLGSQLGQAAGWDALAGRIGLENSLPLEFYSPETFGFLALFGLPHLALARALLLWGLRAYLVREPGMPVPKGWFDRDGARTGLFLAGVWLAQPIAVASAWAVMAGHLGALALWNTFTSRDRGPHWQEWRLCFRRAVWAGLLSAPLMAYSLLSFSTDPFLRQWTSQNLILSPHPVHYLSAFGLLLPLAAVGLPRLMRTDAVTGWLPAAWVLLFPVLAYAPFNLQRRLPEGVWVAWIALALFALESRRRAAGSRPRRAWLAAVPLALSFLTTLFVYAGGLAAAARPSQPVYRPAAEVAAFEALAQQAQPGDVVLTAFTTGNALPAWAPLRVVVGHGPESADLQALLPQVRAVYSAGLPAHERQALLDEWGVRYLFWGPAERQLGDWAPSGEPGLGLFFRAGEYEVYQVLANGAQ